MKAIEDIKALINEMMAQEMENFELARLLRILKTMKFKED